MTSWCSFARKQAVLITCNQNRNCVRPRIYCTWTVCKIQPVSQLASQPGKLKELKLAPLHCCLFCVRMCAGVCVCVCVCVCVWVSVYVSVCVTTRWTAFCIPLDIFIQLYQSPVFSSTSAFCYRNQASVEKCSAAFEPDATNTHFNWHVYRRAQTMHISLVGPRAPPRPTACKIVFIAQSASSSRAVSGRDSIPRQEQQSKFCSLLNAREQILIVP
jgi:hypothetical protein